MDFTHRFKHLYRSQRPVSRRGALRAAALGFGHLGLSGLLAGATTERTSPLAPRQPHFEPKAKRVIFLFMHGGPSSVDTFDPKERLTRDHGKALPMKRPLAFADSSSTRSMSGCGRTRYGEEALKSSSRDSISRPWR